jgi:hypothetical protein
MTSRSFRQYRKPWSRRRARRRSGPGSGPPRPRFLLRVIRLLRWQSVTSLLVFRNHPPRDVRPARSHSGYGPVAQFPGHGYRGAGGQRAGRGDSAARASPAPTRVAASAQRAYSRQPSSLCRSSRRQTRPAYSVALKAFQTAPPLICEQHSGLAVKGGVIISLPHQCGSRNLNDPVHDQGRGRSVGRPTRVQVKVKPSIAFETTNGQSAPGGQTDRPGASHSVVGCGQRQPPRPSGPAATAPDRPGPGLSGPYVSAG